MIKQYFETAEQIMGFANLCEDQEIANVLKAGSAKIFELAQSHGAIMKSASKDIGQDAE